MTIDETIEALKKEARCNRKSGVGYKIEKAGEQEQIVEWLEELKVYKQHEVICHAGYNKGKEAGRNDAIDEFKSKMISFHTDAIFRYGVYIIEAKADAFDELEGWIAEQMKEGAE